MSPRPIRPIVLQLVLSSAAFPLSPCCWLCWAAPSPAQPAGPLLIAHFPTAVCRGCCLPIHTDQPTAPCGHPNLRRTTKRPRAHFRTFHTPPSSHGFSAYTQEGVNLNSRKVPLILPAAAVYSWPIVGIGTFTEIHARHTQQKQCPRCPLLRVAPATKCHLLAKGAVVTEARSVCCQLRAGLGHGGTGWNLGDFV